MREQMPDPAPASSDPANDLIHFGWDSDVASAYLPFAAPGRVPARVLRVDRGGCLVAAPGAAAARCSVPPPGATVDEAATPATGDWLAVRPVPGHGYRLEAILPRRSALRRAGDDGELEVLAANVHTVFVVHGLDRPAKLRKLERALVAVWDGGAEPVVVLTKTDLVGAGEVAAALAATKVVSAGAPVLAVSNTTGAGITHVVSAARPGTTVALVGESGAGKSSLVNRLSGRDLQTTAATRTGDGKGRHTTTAREVIVLPSGVVLIDTPGLRSLALWQGKQGRAEAFADIEGVSAACRFRDCSHTGEPGCAVAEAIRVGIVDSGRLASYRKLGREQEAQERRAAARRRRAEGKAGKRRYRRERESEWM